MLYTRRQLEGQNILILSRQGQNFKMITSAKHEEYILVWAEYVARGFQTLFIMREEGVINAYKDQRDIIDPLRYYDTFEILSLPVQN